MRINIKLEAAPLSFSNLFSYQIINGGIQITTAYDLLKEGHIVNDIGVPVREEKTTFYRSTLRTYVIEYGPIELNNYVIADTGNRLDINRIGQDIANGAIRTQNRSDRGFLVRKSN